MTDVERTPLESFLASVRERVDRNDAVNNVDVLWLVALVDQMRHGLECVHWIVRGSVEGRKSSLRPHIEQMTTEAMQFPPDNAWIKGKP